MNKELAQQLFDTLKSGATMVSDMASKELPGVATQLINWLTAEYAIWTVLSLVTFVTCVRYFFPYLKKDRTQDHEDVFAVFSAIIGFISLPVFLHNLFDLVQVLVAPKIVLLEYLAGFLGGRGCGS